MCGIAGASINPADTFDVTALTNGLLLGIENRGRHATGVAWTDLEGDTWINKDAIAASTFIRGEHVPDRASAVLAHTRWATQGSPKNNDNNHPIDVGGIVGIHNGCIYNDDAIFEMIGADKRIAEVDSEAIFAALVHAGKPVTEVLPLLGGSAAIAWIDLNDASILHVARVSSSPVVFGVTESGSLIFASTLEALERGIANAGLVLEYHWSMPEGHYLQVRDGKIIGSQTFETQSGRSLTATERRALSVA